ncbi:hypothetical protein B9Z55_017358 [Caenorhabditis nigoni]|uniref:Nuclear receptor domain-containing protein n=1 Tax=Caenorhabditis nigoni TaxID=1611254 RepID=A0A2G5T9M1_9PELO|nr:hypothetical protein B9Z55_017358 [Caenorhabditis nigoni]
MDDFEDNLGLTPTSSSSSNSDQIISTKNQFPSICKVCRHPATGYHYNVASCNGCKSFFRRTILSGTRFKCKSNNDCFFTEYPVDSTRLNCRRCRFEACVNSGMNPTAILHKPTKTSENYIMEIVQKQRKPYPVLNTTNEVVHKLISKLSIVEKILTEIHCAGFPDGLFDSRSLEQILTSSLIPVNSEIPHLQKTFTDDEGAMLLLFTHCNFLASVEYSKTFDFYDQISLYDKLILARHVTVACANLHSAFFSINTLKSDCLRFPNRTKIGDQTVGGEIVPVFENTFLAMLRNKLDRVEYMLLKAIVMCNPAVCSLSSHAQSLLSSERNKFGFSLLQYCRLQHGALHGPARYAELLSIIPIVENHVKSLKELHTYTMTVLVYCGHKPFFTNLFCDAMESEGVC